MNESLAVTKLMQEADYLGCFLVLRGGDWRGQRIVEVVVSLFRSTVRLLVSLFAFLSLIMAAIHAWHERMPQATYWLVSYLVLRSNPPTKEAAE